MKDLLYRLTVVMFLYAILITQPGLKVGQQIGAAVLLLFGLATIVVSAIKK